MTREENEALAHKLALILILAFVLYLVWPSPEQRKHAYHQDYKQKSSSGMAYTLDYNTMQSCIAGIKSRTGKSMKIITDQYNRVSGKLSDGRHFICERKSSGTKGIYVNGWYEAG